MNKQQKEAVASVLNGLARNFQGWVRCTIAAMGLDPDNLEAPATSQAEGEAAGAQKGKRKRKEKDPNKKPRAASPYNVYVKMMSDLWKKDHTEGEKPPGGVMAFASSTWPTSFMNVKSDKYDEAKTKKVMLEQAESEDAVAAPVAEAAASPAPVVEAGDEDEAAPSTKKKKKKKKKTQEQGADGAEEDDEATKEKKRMRREKKRLEKAKKAAQEDESD